MLYSPLMRILALETNVDRIKRRFMSEGEEEIITTYYHGASFFFASLREFMYTMILFGIGVAAWYMRAPMEFVVPALSIIWFVFVFFTIFKAFVDWRFDFIFVTTDRIVLMDQTSLIRQRIMPIHNENIASIISETQFWDLFRFGRIVISLKEGGGKEKIVLNYVPDAKDVAARISEVVTQYQRHAVAQAASIEMETASNSV